MKTFIAILIFSASLAAQTFQSGGITAQTTASADINSKGIVVSFTATPPSDKFTQFHWWFGDKLESSEQNPKHVYFFHSKTPTEPSMYLVHLRMASADGHNQAHAEILVKINLPVEFIDPNSIKEKP